MNVRLADIGQISIHDDGAGLLAEIGNILRVHLLDGYGLMSGLPGK